MNMLYKIHGRSAYEWSRSRAHRGWNPCNQPWQAPERAAASGSGNTDTQGTVTGSWPRAEAAQPARHLSNVLASPTPHPECRDFANGFLVAEVLSKYFPADISMHSFQNATSSAEKLLNWSLLCKFLASKGINLTGPTVNAVVSQDQQAVEKFLNQLYMCDPFTLFTLVALTSRSPAPHIE